MLTKTAKPEVIANCRALRLSKADSGASRRRPNTHRKIYLVVLAALLAGCTARGCAGCATIGSVVTQRVTNYRQGAYLFENTLNPLLFSTGFLNSVFGRLYERSVDGQILADILYVHDVQLSDTSRKNLFFIGTAMNCLYAFDLDDNAQDSAPATPSDHCDTSTHAVWHRALGATADVNICGETYPPRVGITSTPVIDPDANAMFVVSYNADDGQHYLHKVDIRTGADIIPSVQIGGSAGGQTFNPACERNRPGLLLQGSVVYVGFATFSCDNGCGSQPYRGWVFGYNESDLTPAGVYTTAPSGGQAGVWQSGNGLVGDGSAIYFETGNDNPRTTLGDSFVKVNVNGASLTDGGHVTPSNADHLAAGDTDLASGGPVMLPGGKLLGGGKQGVFYLVDSSMPASGPDQQWQAFINTWHDNAANPQCDRSNIWAALPNDGCYMPRQFYQDSEQWGPNIHGGPVYWQGASSDYGYVYFMPEKDYLKQFRYKLATNSMETTPFHQTAEPAPDGMPGGAISLSAAWNTNGIVWALIPNANGQWATVPGHMVAYDAESLIELWRDDDSVAFAKFNPPMAAGGHVVRPTFANEVIVYGRLDSGDPPDGRRLQKTQPFGRRSEPLRCYSIAEKYKVLGGPQGYLGEPRSEESTLKDAAGGRFRLFTGAQLVGGSCSAPKKANRIETPAAIYWSPTTCAHIVRGAILAKWEQLGGTGSELGYPVSDEIPTPKGEGMRNVFQHGEIWSIPGKEPIVKGGKPVERNAPKASK